MNILNSAGNTASPNSANRIFISASARRMALWRHFPAHCRGSRQWPHTSRGQAVGRYRHPRPAFGRDCGNRCSTRPSIPAAHFHAGRRTRVGLALFSPAMPAKAPFRAWRMGLRSTPVAAVLPRSPTPGMRRRGVLARCNMILVWPLARAPHNTIPGKAPLVASTSSRSATASRSTSVAPLAVVLKGKRRE
jgi:hypothetical protein